MTHPFAFPGKVYFNGQFCGAEECRISPSDRGFLLGDGFFETLRAFQGKPLFFPLHYLRLIKTAVALRIPWVLSSEDLSKILRQLLEINHLMEGDVALRLTVTRGVMKAGARGLLPEVMSPTILITAEPYNRSLNPSFKVGVSLVECLPQPYKTLSAYLPSILERIRFHGEGVDDCLFFNGRQELIGGSCGNVFVLYQNQLLTSPLANGALPGITRHVLIRLARANRIPVKTHPLSLSFLQQEPIEGIFLTNSLQGIRHVSELLLADLPSKIWEKEPAQSTKLRNLYDHQSRIRSLQFSEILEKGKGEA